MSLWRNMQLSDLIHDQALAVVFFLALINNRVLEYFVVPIFTKLQIPKMGLMYVSLITGLALSWLASANLFVNLFQSPAAGIALTGILIGGGSNLIADILNALATLPRLPPAPPTGPPAIPSTAEAPPYFDALG